ncbi:MAG: hypothetical protein U0354_11890 [Candidatus Sericytochromatia bacterium]
MKNIKLVLLLGLIVSCTPNVNNTLPSPNKINSPSPKGSNFPSSSPKLTETTTITTITTVSTPSPNTEKVKEIKVLSEDNEVIYRKELDKNYIYGENFYVMLSNQKKDFKAELIYNDGNIINYNNDISSTNPKFDFIGKNIKRIKWSSSNSSIANIDENGLINTYNLGESIITATFYENNRELKLTFKLRVVDSFIAYSKGRDKDCNEVLKPYNVQRIGYENYKYPDLGAVADVSDVAGKVGFNGKVYDPNGVPVDNVIVNAVSENCISYPWVGEPQITFGGFYAFRNVTPNTNIIITATKDGWTNRTRNVILKDSQNPTANIFDFSGVYALQDEPEIVSLKINGQQVLKSSKDDEFDINKNIPKYSKPTPSQLSNSTQIQGVGNIPELKGVKPDKLEVEMTFSEPVKVDDVRNYFRITSQSGFNNKDSSFTIDANYSGSEFVVSPDEKTITFKSNKPLLANKGGQEARYLIDFSQAFRDKTDKAAIDRKYFRFSDTQINDFAIFSVKNDEIAPRLLGITATNGVNGANDKIELRYSEPLEVINNTSYQAGLADPLSPKNLKRQMWYRDANDIKIDSEPVKNSIDDNNGTVFGFLSGDDTDTNKFMATYMIGRILSSELANTTAATVKLSALGAKNREMIMTPVKGGTTVNDLIRSAKIEDSKVTLEFTPDAFDSGDVVGLCVSNRITGNSVDRNRTPSINDDLYVNSKGDFINYSDVTDPAGRIIYAGEFGYDPSIIERTDNQRYSIAK